MNCDRGLRALIKLVIDKFLFSVFGSYSIANSLPFGITIMGFNNLFGL